MSFKQFIYQLSIISLFIIALIYLAGLYSNDWASNSRLGYFSIIFFVLLLIITFLIAQKSSQSSNKQLFTGIILLSVLSKLFLSIGLVFWYHKIFHPSGPLFLVPFFLVYIIYTIFESRFMIKLGKDDAKRKSIPSSSK